MFMRRMRLSDRVEFGALIEASLPIVADHWCMGGDFNMLEDASDRQGGSSVTIQGEELASWERLCFGLWLLSDAWHVDEIARASGRIGGSNLSRLDRWYVDEWAGRRGGTVGILAGTTFSDHAPVILQLDDPG